MNPYLALLYVMASIAVGLLLTSLIGQGDMVKVAVDVNGGQPELSILEAGMHVRYDGCQVTVLNKDVKLEICENMAFVGGFHTYEELDAMCFKTFVSEKEVNEYLNALKRNSTPNPTVDNGTAEASIDDAPLGNVSELELAAVDILRPESRLTKSGFKWCREYGQSLVAHRLFIVAHVTFIIMLTVFVALLSYYHIHGIKNHRFRKEYYYYASGCWLFTIVSLMGVYTWYTSSAALLLLKMGDKSRLALRFVQTLSAGPSIRLFTSALLITFLMIVCAGFIRRCEFELGIDVRLKNPCPAPGFLGLFGPVKKYPFPIRTVGYAFSIFSAVLLCLYCYSWYSEIHSGTNVNSDLLGLLASVSWTSALPKFIVAFVYCLSIQMGIRTATEPRAAWNCFALCAFYRLVQAFWVVLPFADFKPLSVYRELMTYFFLYLLWSQAAILDEKFFYFAKLAIFSSKTLTLAQERKLRALIVLSEKKDDDMSSGIVPIPSYPPEFARQNNIHEFREKERQEPGNHNVTDSDFNKVRARFQANNIRHLKEFDDLAHPQFDSDDDRANLLPETSPSNNMITGTEDRSHVNSHLSEINIPSHRKGGSDNVVFDEEEDDNEFEGYYKNKLREMAKMELYSSFNKLEHEDDDEDSEMIQMNNKKDAHTSNSISYDETVDDEDTTNDPNNVGGYRTKQAVRICDYLSEDRKRANSLLSLLEQSFP